MGGGKEWMTHGNNCMYLVRLLGMALGSVAGKGGFLAAARTLAHDMAKTTGASVAQADAAM